MPSRRDEPAERDAKSCLCCDSKDLTDAFRLSVQHGRHEASYERCSNCRSLQLSRVEKAPSYRSGEVLDFDLGSVQRSILTALLVRSLRQVALLPRSSRCLDFGAGLGLLVRLLRDQGFDAWGFDKYPRMANCEGFQVDLTVAQAPFDLVTLIEVFEHLLSPFEDVSDIVRTLSPRGVILVRSELYDERVHGPDWTYLRPEWGGHVNFPSREGLARFGKRLGFKTLFLPVGYCLLVRPGPLREFQRLGASALFLGNIAAARAIGQCSFRHAAADSDLIEAANLRRLEAAAHTRGPSGDQ